jgi:hypothetical protein
MHDVFRDNGVGNTKDACQKWERLSPSERQSIVEEGMRNANIPEDVIRENIDKIMEGEKPGKNRSSERKGPTKKHFSKTALDEARKGAKRGRAGGGGRGGLKGPGGAKGGGIGAKIAGIGRGISNLGRKVLSILPFIDIATDAIDTGVRAKENGRGFWDQVEKDMEEKPFLGIGMMNPNYRGGI